MKRIIKASTFITLMLVISACCFRGMNKKCCNNGITDGKEIGIDCGGICPPCQTCSDGIQNQDEEGIDCGGVCLACATCDDGIRNGNESQIDCGGDCPPCVSCTDGMKNGNEEGIDCGGDCPTACRDVIINKELMITDLNVVNSEEAKTGAFSFGHLMKNMAPSESDADVKAFVLEFLKTWETEQTVNTFPVPARTSIRTRIIEPWKRKDGQPGVSDANWNMNLENAPFRLLAIANRPDLQRMAPDGLSLERAGEGRFIYCAINESDGSMLFNVIFEYNLPGTTVSELTTWIRRWHDLSKFDNFDQDYIDALKLVTEDFAGRGKMPSKPNGSAISQVRTNEVALAFPWELRELVLDPATGMLVNTTTKQTPHHSIDNEQLLRDFVTANKDIIDDPSQTHLIENTFNGQPMLTGSAITNPSSFEWRLDGEIASRIKTFSIETCNGCHGGSTQVVEGIGFVHVAPRSMNQEARISKFLFDEDFETGDLVNRKDVMLKFLDQVPENADADWDAMILEFVKSRGNRTH